MTLTFSHRPATLMTHKHATNQGQRSVGLESDERTDTTDRGTLPANAVSNKV